MEDSNQWQKSKVHKEDIAQEPVCELTIKYNFSFNNKNRIYLKSSSMSAAFFTLKTVFRFVSIIIMWTIAQPISGPSIPQTDWR